VKYPTPKDKFNIEDFNGNFRELDKRVTDQSDYNNLKNKPFGETMVEIMPETEVVGVEDPDMGASVVVLDSAIFTGDENEIVVTFDGIDYKCEANRDAGAAAYGNLSLAGMGVDTGEPFLIIPDLGICLVRDTAKHSLKIAGMSAVRMDVKFSPRTVFYINSDDNYLYADANRSKKVTFSELKNAWHNGQLYIDHNDLTGVMDKPAHVSGGLMESGEPYGQVYICKGNGSHTSGYRELYYEEYYTAEYTP
jgi:hypothetical protein